MQHNEHRLLIPTFVLVYLAYLTHWNLIIESLVSLFVAIVSFGFLFNIINLDKKVRIRSSATLLLLISLIWFSPVQLENWLWGWQLEWFLNIFGVILVAYGLFKSKGNELSITDLLLILLGGIIAQFSLGNGTLVWPIVAVILCYKRVKIEKILITAITGIVTTFLYYYHYSNQGESLKTSLLKNPVHFAEYFFGYLGRSLSFYHKPSMLIGLFLVVTYISINIYLLVKNKKEFSKNLPWVFLGAYAICTAFITGIARLNFGTSESLASRYTTISMLLVISVIMLTWNNRSTVKKYLKVNYKPIYQVTVIGIFSLVLIEFGWGIHSAKTEHQQRLLVKICTHVNSPTSKCLLSTYPNAHIVSGRLLYIKSLSWGGY